VPSREHAILRSIVEAIGDDRRETARAAVGYRAGSPGGPGLVEVFGTPVLQGNGFESRFEADPEDLAAVQSVLADARRSADLVVIALHNHHWDPDWTRTPRWVTDLARHLIDCGADMIVGTGAPVLQAMSFHRGKPILAGLGNFIFHTRRGETYDRQGVDVWTGAICRCSFDMSNRSCRSVEVLPIAVGRPAGAPDNAAAAPSPLGGDAAQRAFDRLTADLAAEDRVRLMRLDPRASAYSP
jgi:poly-gamma-glutamate synthesis protein (capsule biosynthesis protein)